jgi:WD40 repeat protein
VDLLGSLPRHRNLVSCFTFSPDGQYVVSGCADGHARIVPVADPLTPGAATVKQGRGGWVLSPVTSAVYHPSDPVLITIGGARTAVLWDVSDPKKPLRLADLGRAKPRIRSAFASALSADGNMLVVGAGFNIVGLVSLANAREPRVLAAFFVDKGHANRGAPITRRIDQLAIHPGGQSIAAGTARGTVVVWDTVHTESPGDAVVLEDHQAGISGLAYAPGEDSRIARSTGPGECHCLPPGRPAARRGIRERRSGALGHIAKFARMFACPQRDNRLLAGPGRFSGSLRP